MPIYHTNVMMCIADNYAIIWLDSIDDKKEKKAVCEYLLEAGKEITLEQICKELKIQKEDAIIAMESTNAVESMDAAANTENKEGKQMTIFDKISTGNNEEEIITNRMVVNQLINELHDRDKEIILLRFFKEKTQTEVAKILGISQVQVSRIERKILNEMKAKLTSA